MTNTGAPPAERASIAHGRYERQPSVFRHWVTPDGAAGPTGDGGFAAEAGRYHLYVSYSCPWAHRTLILRALKGLQTLIPISVVNVLLGEDGWTFDPGMEVIPDPVLHAHRLMDIYRQDTPDYAGRATTPLLWDKQRGRIVNNESADIVRMFNSAFDGCGAAAGDFYPVEQRAAIDEWCARLYETVNNGVYRAGFATTQVAYEEAVRGVFAMLDELEAHLGRHRYLCGEHITLADWHLFCTLIRFDAVYHGHFKCNVRRLVDYPNLYGYTRELYQLPGVADTVKFDAIKHHYYESHRSINPSGIVPVGPHLAFEASQGRARQFYWRAR